MIKTVSTDSIQDRGTPQALVDLIAAQFGVEFVIDLAADYTNKKTMEYLGYADDSLFCQWSDLIELHGYRTHKSPCGWLNPPFSQVAPWMKKCKIESAKGCKIISLTLSSLGANWYRDHVEGNALSLVLRDRVTFEGCKDPFPKELMVSLWGFGMTSLGFWGWKNNTMRKAVK